MDANDILDLVRAGFTKEEIGKMFSGKAEEKTEQKVDKKVEEKIEEQKEAKVNDTLEDKFNKLMEKLDAANFLNARQPDEETVDDIIANIINPKE